MVRSIVVRLLFHILAIVTPFNVHAQPPQPTSETPHSDSVEPGPPNDSVDAGKQADLDAALAKMLSGAILEGSFTKTGAGSDPAKLSREKYTLGEVKKLAGNLWLFPTRIEYGEKDVTLPITVPIEWAGDTPVVVVDNIPLPGFGAVSARVMFFADHYAGYWKHGASGGHLFGTVRRDSNKPSDPADKE